jgi:hypothetical protein
MEELPGFKLEISKKAFVKCRFAPALTTVSTVCYISPEPGVGGYEPFGSLLAMTLTAVPVPRQPAVSADW